MAATRDVIIRLRIRLPVGVEADIEVDVEKPAGAAEADEAPPLLMIEAPPLPLQEEAPMTPPFTEMPAAPLPHATVLPNKKRRMVDDALPSKKRAVVVEDATGVAVVARSWLEDAVAALLPFIELHSNERNAHPRDARVKTIFTSTRHEYWIDNVLCNASNNWYSPSGLLKLLFPAFDANYVSKKVSEGKNPAYAGRTPEDIKAGWDKNRDRGSAKHAAYDVLLQEGHLSTDVDAVPPPAGFFRIMASVMPEWEVYRTEVSLFDEEAHLLGQGDLVLRKRGTNRLRWYDFKHCVDEDLGAAHGNKCGIHPLTADMPDTKLNHYTWQLNIYCEIYRRHYLQPGWTLDDEMELWNFRPAEPAGYHVYKLPRLDMSGLWALLPWKKNDSRHFDYVHGLGSGVRPFLIPPLADDDPRCAIGEAGGARRVRIQPDPQPADVVWVGAQYPSETARRKTQREFEARRAADPACDVADLRPRYVLPASDFRHPWGWIKGVERAAKGYYERHLLQNRALLEQLPLLAGKRLACWCGEDDAYCHVDVLVKYVNAWANGAWRLEEEVGTLHW